MGGVLELMKSHPEVGQHLLQVNCSRPMTCASIRECLHYNFTEMAIEGTTTSNTQEEETLVVQGWKLFLKAVESKLIFLNLTMH